MTGREKIYCLVEAGDRPDLELKVRAGTSKGALPTVTHSTVKLIGMGDHVARPQTGRTTMSRRGSTWA
ncbi:hypothetical protein [Streptomyces sp. NBC_00102]|uniref:hypothetical protein n=1 Tax=Streptomyces sp. NBC_00102 TaxID=2975652 RepID=UPI002255328B|nr:hypothetical protein [Streptomyces sp. NBC_00102]MCX5398965.1 hypothetical protein [Streptomyces sp. NBC_00102]